MKLNRRRKNIRTPQKGNFEGGWLGGIYLTFARIRNRLTGSVHRAIHGKPLGKPGQAGQVGSPELRLTFWKLESSHKWL